jgi:hypothetical protein
MKGVNNSISTCRRCYFYHLEGRRGGHCQQLGVAVQGNWQACSLGVSPFATWKQLIGIPAWTSSDSTDSSEGLPEGLEPSHACVDVREVIVEAELSQTLPRSAYPLEAAVALESMLDSPFEPVRDLL